MKLLNIVTLNLTGVFNCVFLLERNYDKIATIGVSNVS
jgi:hypothetical protein